MAMNVLLAITNGRLVDPAGQTGERGVLLLKGDSILAAGQVDVPAEAEIIDAGGLLIAPGIIDLCVFKTDKPAFHFGGITRAALMPDQSPPLDDPGLVQHAARAGKPDFWRSEEHTSELQSIMRISYAVFCLKKKTTTT